MEDTSRTERFASPTTPLHLQHVENTHARRNSGEELDGIAVVSDRRRPTNTMSKRMGSSHKNGHGQGDFISIPADAYYVTNETASTSHTGQKYNRRKSKIDTQNKFLGQRHQLFSMIVALVVLSCSFPIYFTVDVFPVNENEGRDGGLVYPVHRAIDLFGANNGMTPRSKDHRPRIVKLGIEQFGSNVHPKYKTHGMSNSFVVNLVELPANSSAMMSDDLSPENENLASKPEPEPVVEEEPEPATPTNSSETKEEKACLPMAKWMTASYPNCNSIHEIDMHEGVLTVTYDNEEDLKFLGQGWFRDTWKYVNDNFEGSPPVVIKTLRIEREFLDEYFDLHRRDAVAMERLTFSPYVVNVHGYCGQSAINELAEGILGGKINNLEQLNRRLRGKETDPNALFLKLQIASKVSLGLAHVHNIHVSDSSGGRSKSIQSLLYEHTDPNTTHSTTGFGRSVATMAHYDVSAGSVIHTQQPLVVCFFLRMVAKILTLVAALTQTLFSRHIIDWKHNTNLSATDQSAQHCCYEEREPQAERFQHCRIHDLRFPNE
jgi:hypothetical protein